MKTFELQGDSRPDRHEWMSELRAALRDAVPECTVEVTTNIATWNLLLPCRVRVIARDGDHYIVEEINEDGNAVRGTEYAHVTQVTR